ncbi:histidine phosphatase family protein [Granulicella cerasi]|uniref:Histidine phosphatase family protein n=1 Tax=Granulicella cerasi TaxID=741063 RepID=A0ABW1Z811_9BACT|nr:histidine phosphatase family protein [Granulicella cerasi]
MSKAEVWLVRHGETEWSLDGRHTSTTDIDLTEHGRVRAEELRDYLKDTKFAAVYVSPMKRAQETCKIAGFGDQMQVDANLMEWNYGETEGKSTKTIREELGDPDWNVWDNGVIGGETVDAVGERCDKIIAKALEAAGDGGKVALFAHAHVLRILTARWIKLAAVNGRLFALSTGSVSVLGFERETRVVSRWNRSFE